MRLLISCLFLVGVASCLPWEYEDEPNATTRSGLTCNCGWVNRGRIVGGKQTGKNEYPLVVALQTPSGFQFCGGTILTPWHVITAAHCTDGQSASGIRVNVGAHYMGAQSEGVHSVARIIQHVEYNARTTVNDISLLLTATEMRFNQNVGPACLPTQRLNLVGQTVKALGWGRIATGGAQSNYLQEVDLRVITTTECIRSWRNARHETNMCTFEVRKDTCQGDSGGPLIWLDPSTNRYTLAALVSYGGECAGPLPAVNTDVSAYLPWIKQNIASSKPGTAACTKA